MGGYILAVKSTSKKKSAENSEPDLDDPGLYINREISWLKLNERILEESLDPSQPLLERMKFLAICGSNLDEFFMVRVSGIKRQFEEGVLKLPADGMSPSEQLVEIRKEVKLLLKRYTRCWSDLIQELGKNGIELTRVKDLNRKQKDALYSFFKENIFPTLTPLAMDFSHPFPFISNLSLNLAVVIEDGDLPQRYARVKVPNNIFPRLFSITEDGKKILPLAQLKVARNISLVLLEDICSSNISELFPGLNVGATYPFRTTRDAEIEIAIDQAGDLMTAIQEGMEERKFGRPVRLEIDASMPEKVKDQFAKNLKLTNDFVYKFDGPLGIVDMWQLLKIDRPDLKDRPFKHHIPHELSEEHNLFASISKRDYVFYYPYDSFQVIVNLIRQAARDPDVLSIKTSLYRIDRDSPVIEALLKAREEDKAVSALVELKAKFDEENNIEWAHALEQAGVHVVYGVEDLKVHSKILQIVRREGGGIRFYSYISSGNFNAMTAKVYADIAYLTSNREIGTEVAEVFNSLTGYSRKTDYKHLLVAPHTLRNDILSSIEREISLHKEKGGGHIALKLNGLTDRGIIKALYKASIAGVRVVLNVRGLCSIKPGIPGISENVSETSIIGRFLEHARIYYFSNGGDEEVLIGSSDLMPRNLYRRIEVLLRVPDPRLKKAIIEKMLNVHLSDNFKARRLLPDGTWVRDHPEKGHDPFNSQEYLISNRGLWHEIQ